MIATEAFLLNAAIGLLAVGAAGLAVLGWFIRPAATMAVACVAGLLVLVDVPAVAAVAAGCLAAAYLLGVHSAAIPGVNAFTGTAMGAALGGCAVALFASVLPADWQWWPLLGPVAAVVIYAVAIAGLVRPIKREPRPRY
ncbi:hypothetical protein GOARA_064_02060 [Gordonia araii NBRC 100433]|uniref:Uncharacterized protein n=1 Tax=Gordonia araii NBRC 100433 TaxID=1073574 RepID=G7H5S9_9ACTN|nr:hypothetical protein [Gordonia araii]NNG95914.1 hypothetical protein [Gordonia araii NBRC 100433]GAB11204.1 hypothetical protein GOARA_064_02060 [Gordonia araii NBRC 100433]